MERGFNRIADLMTADKIESLRDKLAEERLKTSQCEQNAVLINALRPFPTAAYPVNAPYAPYTGFGCGCGAAAAGYGYC